MIPERERILTKIPDYAVDLLPAQASVVVAVSGEEVARSSSALLVRETRHADVYYLPREDVDMERLIATGHSTFCPFKGHASYWSIGNEQNIVWSYENPYPEVAGLKNYLSFYADRATVAVA